jgi:Spondin_N
MQRKTRIGVIGGAVGCVILAAMSVAAAAEYQVTITNLTRGQVFTPILVATHQEGVRLFELGQPASVELEILAEAGDTGPLSTALRARDDVLEVADSGSPLPPGHSVTLAVRTTARFDHVSVAAMLVPTNDGFFAINGVEGPHGDQTLTLFSPAYDAGTEENDERCVHIPGPPSICAGEGFNASRQGAEGYVHIHAGIHGIGDLVAADRDWRTPVAKVTIRRSP